MRRRGVSKLARGGLIGTFLCLALVLTGALQPAEAITFPVSPAVSVNTATGSQLYPGYWGGSCTYQNYFYAYWVDGSGVLWVASSSNGATWNTPVSLLTLTSLAALSITASLPPFRIICAGGASNAMVVIWSTIAAGAAPGIGTTNYIKYEVGAMGSGTVTMSGTIASGPTSNSGAPIKFPNGAGLQLGCANLMNGNVFYCVNDIAGASNSYAMVINNVVNTNFSSSYNGSGGAANSMVTAWNGAGGYILYWDVNGQACDYTMSSDGINWGAVQTLSSSFCAANTQFYITTGIASYNGNFYVPTTISNKGYINVISAAGVNTAQYNWIGSYLTNGHVFVTTDGLGNFAVIGCDQSDSCKYSTTINNFASFTTATSFTWNAGAAGAMGTAGASYWGFGIQTSFSQTLEAFGVESATTAATFYVYETLFGIPLTSSTLQTQTIGQCPTKNTATTTLVNNTEYFYTGSAINPATINTVSTFVAHVTSATAPQTLSLGIYATLNPGAISATNTLYLVAAYSKSLTAGTLNNAINWSPGIGLTSTIVGNIPTGATIGIAILGTNKIQINQSSLAGMSTGSTSGGTLASTYTSLSSNAAQLYLCMTLSYQNVFTTTSTTTATTTSTSTTTVTTAGGGSTPSSFITNPQTPVLFLVLLLPTVVLLFISRNVVGALVGLGIGSVIGVSAGVLDKFLFFALIIGIVAAAFLARNRD